MNWLRRNTATVVVGMIVCAAIGTAFLFLGPWRPDASSGATVLVHDGDGQTHALPLSKDTSYEVRTSLGTNVIVIEDGSARIDAADCPKGSCLHQKPISRPGEQLICLPHKLWVEVVVDVPGQDESHETSPQSHLDEHAVTWDDAPDADVDLVAR